MKTIEAYLALPFTMELSFDGVNFTASDSELKDCFGVAPTCEQAVRLAMQKRKEYLQKMLAEYETLLQTVSNT